MSCDCMFDLEGGEQCTYCRESEMPIQYEKYEAQISNLRWENESLELENSNLKDESEELKSKISKLTVKNEQLEDNAFFWEAEYHYLVKKFSWFLGGIVTILSTALFAPEIASLF